MNILKWQSRMMWNRFSSVWVNEDDKFHFNKGQNRILMGE